MHSAESNEKKDQKNGSETDRQKAFIGSQSASVLSQVRSLQGIHRIGSNELHAHKAVDIRQAAIEELSHNKQTEAGGASQSNRNV